MTLGERISIKKGKKPKIQSEHQQQGFMPYVDIAAFETGRIKMYTDGEKCLPCNNGDLLIVCDGSRSGLIGKAIKGYVGSTLARIDVLSIPSSTSCNCQLKDCIICITVLQTRMMVPAFTI